MRWGPRVPMAEPNRAPRWRQPATDRLARLFACGLSTLCLCSCGGTNWPAAKPLRFEPTDASFQLGDQPEVEVRSSAVKSDGRNRLLLAYSKVGRGDQKSLGGYFRISTDGGATFGPEKSPPGSVSFVEGGLAGILSRATGDGGADLFYVGSDNDGQTWSEPVQVNDEQGSFHSGFGGGFSFLQTTRDDAYCLWTDRRRGFVSLFYSASRDGGRSWAPNQAVEYDFREGEQSGPQLVAGANGRLIAVWIDWRDRQTLADIRSSYSGDGGRHWSPSQRINDDREHVWQVFPSVVAVGGRLCVAFLDFREPGKYDDNTWTIYFSTSNDNGASWEKNVRVDDITCGTDAQPRLLADDDGLLYCFWKTLRESLFGHVAFSFSSDLGRSWSPSIVLDRGAELYSRELLGGAVLSGRRLLCLWRETRFDSVRDRFTWLNPAEGGDSPAVPVSQPDEQPAIEPPTPGGVLFADDFSSETADRWHIASGVWMVADGAWMGVEPESSQAFTSYARFSEPASYVLTGKFKLDSVSHLVADIYFRADQRRGTHYVIQNRFRQGTFLAIRETSAPDQRRASSPRPLVARRFPFQSNRWYEFTLVVAGGRIDYFVAGKLMLSYHGELALRPGSLGLGGIGQSPAHFDDIVVSSLQ